MRPESANDRELVARAKKGEMSAFESLVRKYQQPVYVLCHRITGAHQTADDLAQETFIKAFLALPQFIDGHAFYSWIRRIALNNCFNYLKKRQRERPLTREENVAGGSFLSAANSPPPDALQRDEMERKFREAFRSLPNDQKTVFALRTFEDMSYEEIAQALRIPQGTVMSRLNRARKKLKDRMADYLRRS
ncbi:MAG: sigma-70 family RNA polymerase sigma factor [Candidatus Aminicenantes bacterium]|nr:sigma-70 family RNA polymerase sigma factor [Candidatus Aminicenantes bacterium]